MSFYILDLIKLDIIFFVILNKFFLMKCKINTLVVIISHI